MLFLIKSVSRWLRFVGFSHSPRISFFLSLQRQSRTSPTLTAPSSSCLGGFSSEEHIEPGLGSTPCTSSPPPPRSQSCPPPTCWAVGTRWWWCMPAQPDPRPRYWILKWRPANDSGQFSPKNLKLGQKSGPSVQNSQNKEHKASDLLRESIDSVHRLTQGIQQFCPPTYWGNPLFTNLATDLLRESLNSFRVGLIPTVGPRIELTDSLSRSVAKYVKCGCPQ